MNDSSDSDADVRIPSSKAAGLSLWELPEVTGEHIVALETKSAPDTPVVPQQTPEMPAVGLALQQSQPDDVVTVSEAESIRAAAHEEGLLQGLVEGREQGYPEGLEKGLTEGRERGYEEAKAEGQAEIQQATERLGQMLEQLQKPLSDQELMLETQLAGLVVKLASAVLDAELKTRPDLIQGAIRQALQQLPQGGGELELEVSADDLPHIEPIAERLTFPLNVKADAAISPGSFRLQSEDSLIEEDLQAQFASMASALFEDLQVPDNSGDA